ncbi:hypothetical protein ACFQXB_11615 [Plastorhodobacter daqingensis]|uniref:Sulfotransferase domain-containing protein n=1 Tax=Plastorhodobacter daqingensis TaxID=1387281 RepID=A0ABW2ULM5_9RHOB
MSDPHIVLHGGFHKTATSHIQSLLMRNVKHLHRRGVTYVHHRHTRKQLTIPCMSNAYQKVGIGWKPVIDDAELAALADKFFGRVMDAAAPRLILSDENFAGHCGHCIRDGSLYPFRDHLLGALAGVVPIPVREVHLGIRNYADFFSSAYIEFLRSASANSFLADDVMKRQVLDQGAGWHSAITSCIEHFPAARVHVWRYEDFRQIEPVIMANLCGPTVDVGRFKSPGTENKRPSASGRAVQELLQIARVQGPGAALEQWRELQERFPRGARWAAYDPWSPPERSHLTALYEKDVAAIATDPRIILVRP